MRVIKVQACILLFLTILVSTGPAQEPVKLTDGIRVLKAIPVAAPALDDLRLNSAWTVEQKVDAAKIVGKWDVTESNEPLFKDAYLELTSDGKLSLTLTLGLTFEGTYQVSG